jgi:hypothetical protein
MAKFNREDVVEMLKTGVHTIVFTKRDGTERTMKATLLKETVEPLLKGNDKRSIVYDDIIPVVDTELNEWRSFDIDSLKSID